MQVEKIPQNSPAKNPPKCKQFSQVMASMDLHGIRKLPARMPGGLEQNKSHIFWAIVI